MARTTKPLRYNGLVRKRCGQPADAEASARKSWFAWDTGTQTVLPLAFFHFENMKRTGCWRYTDSDTFRYKGYTARAPQRETKNGTAFAGTSSASLLYPSSLKTPGGTTGFFYTVLHSRPAAGGK